MSDAERPKRDYEYVPDEPPRLGPGRSAIFWTRVTAACLLLGILVVLGFVVGAAFLPEPLRDAEFQLLVIGGVAIAGLGLASNLYLSRVTFRELRAGYTTLHGKYIDHWQLDPKTGSVIRRPGDRAYTRSGMSYLGGDFAASQPREVTVGGTSVNFGVPAEAPAVTGNLTVTGQSAAGHMAVTIDSEVAPSTSTMNFVKGGTWANGVVVPLTTVGGLDGGAFWLVYKAPIHNGTAVIFDVTGYFD